MWWVFKRLLIVSWSAYLSGIIPQDYYSHTVFEFVENVSPSDNRDTTASDEGGRGGIAVLAGGCYDNLAEALGGPPVSCIGWAAGVDRLNLLRDDVVASADTIAVGFKGARYGSEL